MPLAHEDRIHVHVVRAGSGPDLQEWDRLVQLVHHLRVPAEEGVLHGARQRQAALVRIAVVVVEAVLAPEGG